MSKSTYTTILGRLRGKRGRKKKEEPPLPPDTPLERCLDCLHWHSRGELEKRDYYDISDGRCYNSGLQCPPMHHCEAWELGSLPTAVAPSIKSPKTDKATKARRNTEKKRQPNG